MNKCGILTILFLKKYNNPQILARRHDNETEEKKITEKEPAQ